MTAGVARQDKTDPNDSIGKDLFDYNAFSSEADDIHSKSSTNKEHSIRQPKSLTNANKTNSYKYDDIFFPTQNKD